MTAKYYAEKALLKLGVCNLPITANDIQRYMMADGWRFVPYDVDNPQSMELLESLGAVQTAKEYNGFSCVTDSSKLVFYRSSLSAQEKADVFGHEFAHSELGHISPIGIVGYVADGIANQPQEVEANNFAMYFRAPACVLRRTMILSKLELGEETLLTGDVRNRAYKIIKKHHKLSQDERMLVKQFKPYIRKRMMWLWRGLAFTAAILCVGFLISAIIAASSKFTQSEPYQDANPAETIKTLDNKADMVIITQSGDKYHAPGCRYVKNKTNIIEISVGQAEEMGKTPCSVCIK